MKKYFGIMIIILLLSFSFSYAGENSGVGGSKIILDAKGLNQVRELVLNDIKRLSFKDKTTTTPEELMAVEYKNLLLEKKIKNIDYLVLKDYSVRFLDQVKAIEVSR